MRLNLFVDNLNFDDFCYSIKALFGSEISNANLKTIFQKISTNPDSHVDWSEVIVLRKLTTRSAWSRPKR